MIITCPSCSTRFQIGDSALGPAGRRVRCAKCGENWWQDPVPEAAEEQASTTETVDVPAIPEQPVEDPEREQRVEWPEIRSDPPFWQMSDRGVSAGWLLLGLLIASIGAGGWLGHRQVVDMWPKSERLYTALGFPSSSPQPAFDMRETRVSWEEAGALLLVEGRLTNIAPENLSFPEVRLVLRDSAGAALSAIPMRPDGGIPRPEKVESGEGVKISGEILGVPAEAVEAAIFVGPIEPDHRDPG